jgi:hypothetical protein
MNLEIERLAITLQGVSPDLGGRVKAMLGDELSRRLADMTLRTGTDIAHANLGAIEAPAGADAQTLTDLIATQLIGWIERGEQH